MKWDERWRVIVRGAVQGVGFRPFVYRLAQELKLRGWVVNSAQGVFIEIEGDHDLLAEFARRLHKEKPARALIQHCETSPLELAGDEVFEIRESTGAGGKSALILPDLAPCADCLREISEPQDRRFRYPFTNCTNCGPRFSIIEALPYDRARTTMKKFAMCTACAREYAEPADRRFHAEPIACPVCGPQLQLWNSSGETVACRETALLEAAEQIRAGKVVALKGVGGFQLLVDARNRAAVEKLRLRKHRVEKPLAVMFPGPTEARSSCEISELEEQLLASPEAPIVLLRRRTAGALISAAVAPRNPNIGALLPSSPLHYLLLRELAFPVVATSGNRSDEPICIDENEALERLRGLADFFLVHDRPIVRHVDDSIVRVLAGREMMLRRARGYAPLPIALAHPPPATLALGAHLKNAIALSVGPNVFISQHLGDLESPEAYEAFTRSVADLPSLYEARPELIAHDAHPDYLSTKHALQLPGRKVAVQHHWAHVASCMAENQVTPPLLGVAWDGTGYGPDGTIWGGEFFLVQEDFCARYAYFRNYRLPGGEAAVREPRRSALGLLFEVFGEELWLQPELFAGLDAAELKPLRRMLAQRINSPATSSVGRLFDAFAALAKLRDRSSFEGQAAMELEFAVDEGVEESYPFSLGKETPIVIDWEPAVRAILEDRRRLTSVGRIAARFHHFLADVIVAVARRAGLSNVVLSGGCFQNRYLTERVIAQLRLNRFQPHWHQRVPPNDGGIALGQIYLAGNPLRELKTLPDELRPR